MFNTLSTPHGACTLPGEDLAERHYRSLEDADAAVARGDRDSLVEAVASVGRPELPADVPTALRDAIDAMAVVIDEARRDPDHVLGDGSSAWLTRSIEARRRVIRMSVEMRMVVSIAA